MSEVIASDSFSPAQAHVGRRAFPIFIPWPQHSLGQFPALLSGALKPAPIAPVPCRNHQWPVGPWYQPVCVIRWEVGAAAAVRPLGRLPLAALAAGRRPTTCSSWRPGHGLPGTPGPGRDARPAPHPRSHGRRHWRRHGDEDGQAGEAVLRAWRSRSWASGGPNARLFQPLVFLAVTFRNSRMPVAAAVDPHPDRLLTEGDAASVASMMALRGPGWRDFASGSERNRSENGGRIRSVAGLEPASSLVVDRAGTGSRDLEVSAKRRPPQGQAVRRPADRARRQSPRTRSSTGLYGEEAAESYTVRNAQIRRSPPDALCRSCPVRAATDRCHRRPALAQ